MDATPRPARLAVGVISAGRVGSVLGAALSGVPSLVAVLADAPGYTARTVTTGGDSCGGCWRSNVFSSMAL